jgi:hypothetical protein
MKPAPRCATVATTGPEPASQLAHAAYEARREALHLADLVHQPHARRVLGCKSRLESRVERGDVDAVLPDAMGFGEIHVRQHGLDTAESDHPEAPAHAAGANLFGVEPARPLAGELCSELPHHGGLAAAGTAGEQQMPLRRHGQPRALRVLSRAAQRLQ